MEIYRGTERRDLEKKVHVLIRLNKGNYAHNKPHSDLLKFLQKNIKSQVLICLIFIKLIIMPISQKPPHASLPVIYLFSDVLI